VLKWIFSDSGGAEPGDFRVVSHAGSVLSPGRNQGKGKQQHDTQVSTLCKLFTRRIFAGSGGVPVVGRRPSRPRAVDQNTPDSRRAGGRRLEMFDPRVGARRKDAAAHPFFTCVAPTKKAHPGLAREIKSKMRKQPFEIEGRTAD